MKSEVETIAIASAVMGGDRPTATTSTPLKCPTCPHLKLHAAALNAAEIAYMRQLDVRPCWGGIPMSGHEAHSREDGSDLSIVQVLGQGLAAALLDMWWPTILVTGQRVGPWEHYPQRELLSAHGTPQDRLCPLDHRGSVTSRVMLRNGICSGREMAI